MRFVFIRMVKGFCVIFYLGEDGEIRFGWGVRWGDVGYKSWVGIGVLLFLLFGRIEVVGVLDYKM